ncbi:MAG: aminodeoxychorismate/anthranilate synthase component II [Candidatus Schekmanbacteria bacterium]|nr:aminodeoxychorismate/anthranilate synthase component II [Candidatus Schekmanbacteria bacterium]
MILVIDNYDSFTYNLVQLLWALELPVVVRRNDKITVDQAAALRPEKLLLSPGPGCPDDAGVTLSLIAHFASRIPILGVCLGHQAIGQQFGGKVVRAPTLMHGKTSMIHHDGQGSFAGVESPFIATRYHSLIVEESSLPTCLNVSARTEDGIIMGLRHREYPVEGVQFHPESILTDCGPRLIANFAGVPHRPELEPRFRRGARA